MTYGVTKEEAARFGLPCGGNLRLVQEPLHDIAWITDILERTARHELVGRRVDLATGSVSIEPARPSIKRAAPRANAVKEYAPTSSAVKKPRRDTV